MLQQALSQPWLHVLMGHVAAMWGGASPPDSSMHALTLCWVHTCGLDPWPDQPAVCRHRCWPGGTQEGAPCQAGWSRSLAAASQPGGQAGGRQPPQSPRAARRHCCCRPARVHSVPRAGAARLSDGACSPSV